MGRTNIIENNQKIILLVEDQILIAISEAKLLRENNFEVIIVSSAEKAIKIAEENPTIDLILMDIDLGKGMDGTEASKIILNKRNIPIVFLSNHTEPEVVEKTEGITSYGYIVKDSGDTVILASIKMAFRLFEANNKIAVSESLYRTTLYCIGDAVITTDKSGMVKQLNTVAEGLTGWKEIEAEGKPLESVFNIINEGTRKKVESPVSKVLSEGIIVGLANHTLLISKDGREFPIADSGAPIKNKNGEIIGVVLVFRDQTEERNRQKLLEESEERNRIISNLTTDYAFIVDIDRDYEIKLRWASDNMSKITGRSENEVKTSDTWKNIFHKDDYPKFLEFVQKTITTKIPGEIECRSIRKNDQETWLHILVYPKVDEIGNISIIGAVKDITHRKNAEKLMAFPGIKYSELINNIDGIFWEANAETFQFTFVSPQAEKILGYPINDWLDSNTFWAEHIHPEDRDKAVNYCVSLTKKGESHDFEYRMISAYGQIKWIRDLVTVEVIDGIPKILRGVMMDVSERKESDLKIKSLLAEKELLLKEVHHRIKNNMSITKSIISLQANTINDKAAVDVLLDAENRIQSMSILYDKLYRSENMRTISINEYLYYLIRDIVKIFPNNEKVKIVTNIDEFFLDEKILSSIGIIVNELITNTMKHAFKEKNEGIITVSSSLKGKEVILSIEDNGIGLPELIDIKSSTQFGLQLVHMLSEQINAELTVERNNGTKFTLKFQNN